MAFATAADMVARYDARTLGALCSDDNARVASPELQTNPAMIAALDDATASIMAVLFKGERYNADDLANQQSADGSKYLVYICCLIAYANLWRRRDMTTDNETKYKQAIEEANQRLADLGSGKHVLDIPAQKQAGRAETQAPGVSAVTTTWELVRDRLGNMPARRGIRR